MNETLRDTWFLTGPTASGKSAAALILAEQFGLEIVAMDSMTLYRGMDIGTAKPTPEDRKRVPHHLLDVLEPHESGTVDWYRRQALAAIDAIAERGCRPLVVGGTPLYLKALLRGMFVGPPADPEFRAHCEAVAVQKGRQALHDQLIRIDPQAADRIHPTDVRRIIRALEVHHATGQPISALQQQFEKPADLPPRVACIAPPRPVIHSRIHERIDRMLADGWIDEVASLLRREPPMSPQARQAVGYAEIAEFLAGSRSQAEMREAIRIRTRQFAKHQETWFRHLEEVTALSITGDETAESIAERLAKFFHAEDPPH